MEESVKNLWLDKIKSGKVAVIESHYAPKNNTNCIWLKDGAMYVFGNSGWESFGTGDGVDKWLIKPNYPVEIPWDHTNESQVAYADINEPTVVPYTYMPDEAVYIIGKKNDAYTLIGTLPTEGIGENFSRDVSATLWSYGQQEIEYNPAHFESAIIDTNKNSFGRITVGVSYDIFEEGGEPTWAWVSYVFTNYVPAYDSLIFDTEYNTDKYPNGGGEGGPIVS